MNRKIPKRKKIHSPPPKKGRKQGRKKKENRKEGREKAREGRREGGRLVVRSVCPQHFTER